MGETHDAFTNLGKTKEMDEQLVSIFEKKKMCL